MFGLWTLFKAKPWALMEFQSCQGSIPLPSARLCRMDRPQAGAFHRLFRLPCTSYRVLPTGVSVMWPQDLES